MENKEKLIAIQKVRTATKSKYLQAKLRLHLKTSAQGSKDLRTKIHRSIVKQKNLGKSPILEPIHLKNLKEYLGQSARHTQLALGFINGLFYKDIERKTREDNLPSVGMIVQALTPSIYMNVKDLESIVTDWISGEEYVLDEHR